MIETHSDLVSCLLSLREHLVRHDENIKAWRVLEAAPYTVWHDPRLVKARADQWEMVKHAFDPQAYREYYADNVHERPFEEQFGIQPELGHMIPRLGFLIRRLTEDDMRDATIVDLSCNDGGFAAALAAHGIHNVNGVDLNPECIRRARVRQDIAPAGNMAGHFACTDFREPPAGWEGTFDAAVLYETIEHTLDPADSIRQACRYLRDDGPRLLFVSCPELCNTGGVLPEWDKVEPKGHLWAISEDEFRGWLDEVGELLAFEKSGDNLRVMAAQVKVD